MARMPRTRLALLAAVLLALVLPRTAAAVTNTVAFSGKLAMATSPSAEAPANTGFGWAHHIATSPAGSHPDTADSFRVLFPSPLILNAQDFPACDATAADGRVTLPTECQNAVIGSGTARMYAGSPGSPLSNSVGEDLTVTIVNATPAGSAMLLVISSTPSAPIAISNRVIKGEITSQPGYAFGVEFRVPADLQMQLGLSIVITDLDVTISGTPRLITVGAKTDNMSYLQLPDCGTALPAQQLTFFRSASSASLSTVTSDASIACAMGSFPDPPGFPTAPYTSPRVPPPAPEQPASSPPLITIPRAGTNLGVVKVRRNGRVPLRGVAVQCPPNAANPCRMTARATGGRVLVATASMRIAAGAHSPVVLELTRAGTKLLSRKKSLSLAANVHVTPPGGSVTTRTVRLKLVR